MGVYAPLSLLLLEGGLLASQVGLFCFSDVLHIPIGVPILLLLPLAVFLPMSNPPAFLQIQETVRSHTISINTASEGCV